MKELDEWDDSIQFKIGHTFHTSNLDVSNFFHANNLLLVKFQAPNEK